MELVISATGRDYSGQGITRVTMWQQMPPVGGTLMCCDRWDAGYICKAISYKNPITVLVHPGPVFVLSPCGWGAEQGGIWMMLWPQYHVTNVPVTSGPLTHSCQWCKYIYHIIHSVRGKWLLWVLHHSKGVLLAVCGRNYECTPKTHKRGHPLVLSRWYSVPT